MSNQRISGTVSAPTTSLSKTIDLMALKQMSTMSAKVLDHLAEAASVMLDRFHSRSEQPKPFEVYGVPDAPSVFVVWEVPSQDVMASHANDLKATEDGAEGVAIASVYVLLGYIVRKRAFHGSGSDLLMTRQHEPDNDYVKLEVSGIARGGSFGHRQTKKKKQAIAGDLDRPWAAVVVAFERARLSIEEGK